MTFFFFIVPQPKGQGPKRAHTLQKRAVHLGSDLHKWEESPHVWERPTNPRIKPWATW